MTEIRDMVEYVTTAIVNDAEAVSVSETATKQKVSVEIRVAPKDMGRIIGRRGRMVNSIRALARVLGKKQHKKTDIEIIEPGN